MCCGVWVCVWEREIVCLCVWERECVCACVAVYVSVYKWGMTHSHVVRDSSWDITQSYVGHDSFTWRIWLIHMYLSLCKWGMTHSHVGRDSFCGIWLSHMWDMTPSHAGHDSFTCGTGFIHTRGRRECEWIMSQISMSHVLHVKESCPTYAWVTLECTSRFSRGFSRTHANARLTIHVGKLSLYKCNMTHLCMGHDSFAVASPASVPLGLLRFVPARVDIGARTGSRLPFLGHARHGARRDTVCCRVLQGVAACCRVLQCVVCCSVLQCECIAACRCRVLQRVAACYSTLQCVAV